MLLIENFIDFVDFHVLDAQRWIDVTVKNVRKKLNRVIAMLNFENQTIIELIAKLPQFENWKI